MLKDISLCPDVPGPSNQSGIVVVFVAVVSPLRRHSGIFMCETFTLVTLVHFSRRENDIVMGDGGPIFKKSSNQMFLRMLLWFNIELSVTLGNGDNVKSQS